VKDVLLSRVPRLIVALPVLVLCLWAGEACARWAAHVKWLEYWEEAKGAEAEFDCDRQVFRMMKFIKRNAPDDVVLRAGRCAEQDEPDDARYPGRR